MMRSFLDDAPLNKGGHHDGTRLAGHRGNPFCHVGDWVDHAAGFNRGLFLKGQAG